MLPVYDHRRSTKESKNTNLLERSWIRNHSRRLQSEKTRPVLKNIPQDTQINAYVERFDRTIQEDFVDYHHGLLSEFDRFNEKLIDRLVFYNSRRIRHAFNTKWSPLQYLVEQGQLSEAGQSTCGHTGAEKTEQEVVVRSYKAYNALSGMPWKTRKGRSEKRRKKGKKRTRSINQP